MGSLRRTLSTEPAGAGVIRRYRHRHWRSAKVWSWVRLTPVLYRAANGALNVRLRQIKIEFDRVENLTKEPVGSLWTGYL